MESKNSGTMATPEIPHREMMNRFIESLRNEQFLDESFSFKNSKEEDMESWSTFCAQFQTDLDQLSGSLANEEIDFEDVDCTVTKMKANAARIGGKRLAEACDTLQQFSTGDSNIDGCKCMEAYKIIREEYYTLRDCFTMILQAERTTLLKTKK